MKTETKRAVRDAFAKLAPRCQAKNPVMFMVYLSACLTTALVQTVWSMPMAAACYALMRWIHKRWKA